MPHDAIQTCILPVDRILLRCREQFLSCADATALKQVASHATRRLAASADESQATTRSGQSMLNREACRVCVARAFSQRISSNELCRSRISATCLNSAKCLFTFQPVAVSCSVHLEVPFCICSSRGNWSVDPRKDTCRPRVVAPNVFPSRDWLAGKFTPSAFSCLWKFRVECAAEE